MEMLRIIIGAGDNLNNQNSNDGNGEIFYKG